MNNQDGRNIVRQGLIVFSLTVWFGLTKYSLKTVIQLKPDDALKNTSDNTFSMANTK
ncbi:hypothetical protein GCM10011412_01210 [Maribacter cobaltidurans]|nr:hypothetical protein GCM10011412_01210 [Maribacter cobaltidurans]